MSNQNEKNNNDMCECMKKIACPKCGNTESTSCDSFLDDYNGLIMDDSWTSISKAYIGNMISLAICWYDTLSK